MSLLLRETVALRGKLQTCPKWTGMTPHPRREEERPVCPFHLWRCLITPSYRKGCCPSIACMKELRSGVSHLLITLVAKGEHGDAGGYAATGLSSTSRSMSGYQRLKMALSSPFSVRTRVCNNKCAPSFDHCICCFLQKRLLTTSFTVDSTNPVAIGSPLR